MIDSNGFVSTMEQHWVEHLGNVSSPALRAAWRQLAEAFASHITAHGSTDSTEKWTVLQPPTGSGKSQGTAVYCSLLSSHPDEEHPGVLIVTRLKADADQMAEQINKLSSRATAAAYHSDSTLKLPDLLAFPVLVITHRAYEIALDYLGQEGSIRQTWPYFHSWQEHGRKLVVIDEALDIVEESQAGLDGLRQTLGAIPQTVRREFAGEVDALTALVQIFEAMEERAQGVSTKEAVLLRQMVEAGTPPNITALRSALRTVRFDHQMHRVDDDTNKRLGKLHDDRLRSVTHIFQSWVYYSKVDASHTLNTARLLVPEGSKGAVVLDATASQNLIYQLFEKAQVIAPPDGVRNYQNVTLHVSKGHKVGKVYMRNNAKELTGKLIANLNETLNGREVFVCCHKAVEPVLAAHQTTFKLHTGHWGAVDGSNAWQACDAAVIFGLPYRPDTWAANAFFALQGVQDTEWLRADHRPWGTHDDIRSALKVGQLVTEVVQAVNRIRCRKVVDQAGNCPKADVYILLPPGKDAEEILQGVLEEMPGIRVTDWDFGAAKKKARRGNHEAALVKYIETMYPGRRSVSKLKLELGISDTRFKVLLQDMKNPSTRLGQALALSGVRFQVERSGRSFRSYFIKD